MNQIIKNFKEMYTEIDAEMGLFTEADPEKIEKLKGLFGNEVSKIIDFYNKHEPNNLPMLDSYVRLLDIDAIIEENTNLEPGIYLAEYGVYIFATTVGGNGLCIDTNDVNNGDASVLIVDANFCSYNEFYNCVVIDIVPQEVIHECEENKVLCLNYSNIKKCLTKIEDSFFEFMKKLSKNEYEDIEEYLDEDVEEDY